MECALRNPCIAELLFNEKGVTDLPSLGLNARQIEALRLIMRLVMRFHPCLHLCRR